MFGLCCSGIRGEMKKAGRYILRANKVEDIYGTAIDCMMCGKVSIGYRLDYGGHGYDHVCRDCINRKVII